MSVRLLSMKRLISSVVELRSCYAVMFGCSLIILASLMTALAPLFLTVRIGSPDRYGENASIVLKVMERLRPCVTSFGSFKPTSPDWRTKFY